MNTEISLILDNPSIKCATCIFYHLIMPLRGRTAEMKLIFIDEKAGAQTGKVIHRGQTAKKWRC